MFSLRENKKYHFLDLYVEEAEHFIPLIGILVWTERGLSHKVDLRYYTAR